MKKISAIVLAIALILSFAACSKKPEAFDPAKASETLKASESFKNAVMQDPDDVEFEFDITLEDCESFYMAKDTNSRNMYIIAKAKAGSEKLMYAELAKIEKAYCDEIKNSTYTDINQHAGKVDARYQSSADGIYIVIISEDSKASAKLIGK